MIYIKVMQTTVCAMDGAVTNALAGVLSQTKLQAIKSAGTPILWQISPFSAIGYRLSGKPSIISYIQEYRVNYIAV